MYGVSVKQKGLLSVRLEKQQTLPSVGLEFAILRFNVHDAFTLPK